MNDEGKLARSYIALGSNIGDAIANVKQAISQLSKIAKVGASSSLYVTKPWGYLDQPDFINAVVLIETNISPHKLLDQIQTIEKEMGRQREIHWGPRTIDLDILTYDNQKIDEPNLQIPHPHMLERAFVLAPLSEIDANYAEAYNKLSSESRKEIQRL